MYSKISQLLSLLGKGICYRASKHIGKCRL
uniref:Uncharacterized protein n=1 Tax=virus sp. ctML55 TaxID=2827627 RepID=A0A8S5RI54_9VIRU|nr:MAG TPA: hypothetical protein [virus sp. ctML55]